MVSSVSHRSCSPFISNNNSKLSISFNLFSAPTNNSASTSKPSISLNSKSSATPLSQLSNALIISESFWRSFPNSPALRGSSQIFPNSINLSISSTLVLCAASGTIPRSPFNFSALVVRMVCRLIVVLLYHINHHQFQRQISSTAFHNASSTHQNEPAFRFVDAASILTPTLQ